jgi:hypothetical protein
VGTYADTYRASSCDSCNAGTYTLNQKGSANCTLCPSGKYSTTRSANCTECATGRYSTTTTGLLASCVACAAGKYADEVGSASCTSCDPGTYQGATGQASCNDCEVTNYNSMLLMLVGMPITCLSF